MQEVFYNELREVKQQSQKAFHTGLHVTTKKEKGKNEKTWDQGTRWLLLGVISGVEMAGR